MFARILPLLAAAGVLAATGCATARTVASGGCEREWRPLVLGQVLEVVPGETRTLPRPKILDGPFGEKELPDGCGVRWGIRGRGVTLDQRGTLRVSADAQPGDTIHVLASVAGTWMRAMGFVVDPAPHPLAGTWSQRDWATCREGVPHPPGRIGELILRRNGRYWVTARPFERVYGPTGLYEYDQAAGRLVLHPPQPSAPGRRSEGYRFTFNEAGALVIDPLGPGLLGMPHCRAIFHRVGN
ncbi:MAG TPA: hypothetical protein VEX86_01820 [Longimicrobium sp.]|nr:hypothetical protein [Longimicrobium sp.]